MEPWIWAAPPVALIFLAHLWYGANASFAALVLAACEGLLLLAVLCHPGLRSAIARAGIWRIGSLFGLVLIAALVSLTPFVVGGPHPIWSYVPVAGAGAIDRARGLIEIIKLLGLACIFLVGLGLGAKTATSTAVRRLFVGAGGLFAVTAIGLFLSRDIAGNGSRLTANLTSANCAATVFGVLTVLSLSVLAGAMRRGSERGNAVESSVTAYAPGAGVVLLFFVCLVLTASRGGLLSTAVAALAFLLLQAAAGRMKARALLGWAAALTVVSMGLLLLKGGLLVERLGATSITDNDRTPMFALHWKAFLASPIQGYGLGSFAEINRLVLDARTYAIGWTVRDLHNVYLQWLEEGGLLGAIPMFASVGLVLGLSALALRDRRPGATWLRALVAANLVVLCHGLTDFALQVPSIAAMWALLLGVQAGIAFQRPTRV